MSTVNLGILAHVDAGKTSLTERLLHAAGVIDEIGSVDDGTTQTDSLALERQRGITIKSAVVSFVIGPPGRRVTVNLIDTPGHPDFIAEVERVLSVLDGAVLVISAVEGVQAQTRVLMRTLRRLRIPTLIFVNKIDRRGARDQLDAIAAKLTPAIVPMGVIRGAGDRQAAFVPYGPADDALAAALADHDDAILAMYVNGSGVPYARLRRELATRTRQARAHPVFFGSAITGAGVDALTGAIAELLPPAGGDPGGPLSGSVFKVERGPAGEKIAYARLFSGTVRPRDRIDDAKITEVRVFEHGTNVRRPLVAGEIGRLWGMSGVRIGDAIGAPARAAGHHFAPPTLETAVVPRRPADKGALHAALAQLAEQDPLIDLRQDDIRQELFLSLYGEVQKEVIQQTLAAEFALDVEFRETTTICVERPTGSGEAAESLRKDANPFLATVGLRVDPAAPGSGVTFRTEVKIGAVPLYVYKAAEEFHAAMDHHVRETLRQGLHGWEVVDCAVTLTQCGYQSPETSARDFRLLTPLVLMSALRRAGTVVCEPIHRFHLEAPPDSIPALLPVLARLRAVPEATGPGTLDGEIPAAQVHDLRLRLRGLTHGEGVLESAFDHHAPVGGPPPTRPRTDHNPLSRKEYLLHVRRVV
ncbi:TetM/TetW/TetO/TetS family tetracycline resistance ribosomal protection protein [Streptosporangiaceae bacterium NEAU-GS5]|nr:TetM/TetW/TetO/TetS family tetracycline resistance ribosomal protection protein [Streptosporangiaceae bacterium NEAU-GS5]